MGGDTTKKDNEQGFFYKLFHRGASKKDDKKADDKGTPKAPPSQGNPTPQTPSQTKVNQMSPEEAKKTTSEMKDEERKESYKAQKDKERELAYH